MRKFKGMTEIKVYVFFTKQGNIDKRKCAINIHTKHPQSSNIPCLEKYNNAEKLKFYLHIINGIKYQYLCVTCEG